MPIFGLFEIGRQSGLYGFIAILLLILLYLIRPKPQTLKIPSLMFLLREKGRSRMTSFLRNLVRELLLLLQLLALLFLVLALTEPYIYMDLDVSSKNTVIVLDVSASMQTKQGLTARFEVAKSLAKDYLGDKNTIILAKNIPVIGIEDTRKSDTIYYLNSLMPTETSSRIGASILIAGELLTGKEGRVIVISDFINTGGISPKTAKAVLESKGVKVDFVNVGDNKQKDNLAIVDLKIDDESSTIYIKNYNDDGKTITLSIAGSDKKLTIAGNSIEPYSFKTPEGINKIEIKDKDDMVADNIVTIHSPFKQEIKVLLITNNKSFYLDTILTSLPFVKLEVNEPPIVSKDKYDVYIMHDVTASELLPGTIEAISGHVKAGSNLIIHAQDYIGVIDYNGLMPVQITEEGQKSFIVIDQVNKITKNIDLGKVDRYFKSTPTDNSITLASIEGSPILSYKPYGDGKVFYYGIIEQASEFKLTPYYPIFWSRLLKFLVEKFDINTLNLKTGDTIIRQEEIPIKTPYTSLKTNSLLLDYSGMYKIDNVDVAVNMLDESESDINQKDVEGDSPEKFTLLPVKERQKVNIEILLVVIASLFFTLELLYIKLRGDI